MQKRSIVGSVLDKISPDVFVFTMVAFFLGTSAFFILNEEKPKGHDPKIAKSVIEKNGYLDESEYKREEAREQDKRNKQKIEEINTMIKKGSSIPYRVEQ